MELTGHPLERYCASRADRLVGLPVSFDDQLRIIRGDDLDVLFIGANAVAVSSAISRLALYRCARVQMTSICSPTTTGMRNMDCYVAGELALPSDDPQRDYTEHLVTLPGSGICFSYGAPVTAIAVQAERGQAGIPEQAIVYISGSNFFKLMPAVRDLYARIMAGVPGSVLVMYPFNPNWSDSYPASTAISLTTEMQSAFARYGVEPERLIMLQPRENFAEIQAILRLADVYLDSFPYSGATSIVDALQAHLPPVVMDGRYLRFRQAAAILRELDLSDLVAAGEQEYLDLAVRLGRESSLRMQLVEQIRTNLGKPGNFLDSHAFSQQMGRVFEEQLAGYRIGGR
jgi:predicted O-linked N-acetylglucosamine transferase (SPINDLY family)